MSDVLEKAAEGKVFADNAKPNFGRYRFRILGHKHRDGFNGNFLIAEMLVLAAENLGATATPAGATPAPQEDASRVGATVSYTENIDNPKKGGPSRFQTHLARVFDFDKALNLGQLRYVTGKDDPAGGKQPGFGLEVDCEVSPKWLEPDPKKGYTVGKWVKHYRWSTAEDQDLGAVDKLRREAGLVGDADSILDELERLGQ